MELSEKELTLLAKSRVSHNKRMQWDARYAVPTYGLCAISFILLCIVSSDAIDNSLDNELTIVGWGALVMASVVYWLWVKKVKQPYIRKFIAHYKETHELMD